MAAQQMAMYFDSLNSKAVAAISTMHESRDLLVQIPHNSWYRRWQAYDFYVDQSPATPCSPQIPLLQLNRRVSQFSLDSDAVDSEFESESRRRQTRYERDYEEQELLGTGAHTKVYSCIHKFDGLHYAVKKVKIENNQDPELQAAIQEAYTLAQSSLGVDNTYVVRYYGVWIENNVIYIAMELCQYSLSQYVTMQEITEDLLVQMLTNVCKGLKKLHKQNIVHLDIRQENILYSYSGKFKLADLGMARMTTGLSRGSLTRVEYSPQEILNGNQDIDYTKADMFQLGATALEIITQKPITGHLEVWEALENNAQIFPRPYSFATKNLIKNLLHIDPIQRPSAKFVLNNFLMSPYKREIRQLKSYSKWLKMQLAVV